MPISGGASSTRANDVFDGIEFGRIRRQVGGDHPSAETGNVVLH